MTEATAQWLPNALVFRPGTTFEEWQDEWNKVDAVDKAIQWVIGDALLYGENNFENWTQVVDPKYAEKHRPKLWLAKAIPPEQRRERFSYSFHRELGSLDQAERNRWFERAEAEGWDTVARLKEERGKRPTNGGPPMVLDAPPPTSEADYGTVEVPQLTEPEPAPRPAPIPQGNWAETMRALIEDVRELGDGILRQNETELLTDRIAAALKRDVGAPLYGVTDALELKPLGWRATIIEKDDGFWEVRLRADGQKMAIAMSAYLENAITEACLAAELSNGQR